MPNLILIHPFREGNGRCARLLAMLMGLQAGLPTLDFGGIRGAKKKAYIAAVHAALDRDYAPMTEVFRSVIVDSEVGDHFFFRLRRRLRTATALSARVAPLNSARIPSIADDVTTDLITMLSRTAGSRR
jgi:Fic/DOC family